jgi:hypothetical protein
MRRIIMGFFKKSFSLMAVFFFLLPGLIRAENSTPVDISKWFNNDAIASEGKINDGDFDGGGFTYPKEQLPSAGIVEFKAIKFIFPSARDSVKNNIMCKGQIITLPGLKANAVYFLGASAGKSFIENFNLVYTDGTADPVKVGLSDWCVEPLYNESAAVKASLRYTGKDKEPTPCNIWIQKIAVPHPEKTVATLVLTANPGMHIFSISLAGGTTGQLPDQKSELSAVNTLSVSKDGKFVLDALFNNKGIASKDKLQAGNFDGGGFSFPSEELPKGKISADGIDFNLKISDSANDNIKCGSQNLDLKGAVKGTVLGIAASAEYGNYKDMISVIYADKEKVDIDFGLSDWCAESAGFGEKELVQFPYRYSPTGPDAVKAKIWFSKIPLKNKPVSTIILPGNEHIHIFGMTVK